MQTFWNELNKQNFQETSCEGKTLGFRSNLSENDLECIEIWYIRHRPISLVSSKDAYETCEPLFLWTSTNTTKLLLTCASFLYFFIHFASINDFKIKFPTVLDPFHHRKELPLFQLTWSSLETANIINWSWSYKATIRWVNLFFLSLYLIFCDCLFNICFCNQWQKPETG